MTQALLSLTGVVFLVWTVLMFRALFRLRRWAVLQSGRAVPGMRDGFETLGAFGRAPAFRTDRRLLGAVTLALFALTFLSVWTALPPSAFPSLAPVAPGLPMPPAPRG